MTTRREQVREAIVRHRKRRQRGLFLRPIIVTKDQLDQLEVRGYLDPDLRGERADECDAIETFLHRCASKIQIVFKRLPPSLTTIHHA
jgi:hypothetical protein